MNKQFLMTIICASLVSMMAIQALAALPTSDPTKPSKFINRKALYYGTSIQVPPSSSSEQLVTVSARLGDSFPKGILSPTFAGRLTGYATLDKLTPKKASVPKTKTGAAATLKSQKPTQKTESYKKTMISGNTKDKFPKGKYTKTFEGRWFGDSKTHIKNTIETKRPSR